MKKHLKTKIWIPVLCLVLIFAGSRLSFPVFAFNPGIGIANPGRVDQGAVVSIGFSCNADATWVFQGTISVSGGEFRGAAFEQVSGNTITTKTYHGANEPAGGSIQIYVTSDSALTITINGTFGDIDNTSQGRSISVTQQIGVRSIAQQQADNAAAAQAAQEAAQRQAAADAAAAEEAARQASINESIQAEEAAKAAEEASIAAAESEKASIEESIKEESMSIEASIAYESRMASLEESREAHYKEISLAAIEATRAYAIDEMYFVPYGSKYMFAQHFLFAVANTIEPVPEGFTRVPLTVNDQEVDAFRSDDMAEGVYLVYGKKSEKSEPDFYYFQLDDDSLISYRDVNGVEAGEIPKVYADLVHLQEQEVETGNGSKVSYGPAVYIFYLVLSLIIFVLAGVIIYLLKKQKKNEEEAAAAASVPETEPESTAVKEPDPVLPKTGENKSGPKNPQKKKSSGPKRKNRTHNKK